MGTGRLSEKVFRSGCSGEGEGAGEGGGWGSDAREEKGNLLVDFLGIVVKISFSIDLLEKKKNEEEGVRRLRVFLEAMTNLRR